MDTPKSVCRTEAIYRNKDIVNVFFTMIEECNGDQNTVRRYRCSCGTIRKQNTRYGYTNLINHIYRSHVDWRDVMASVYGYYTSKDNRKSISNQFLNNAFVWIEWIVMENREIWLSESKWTKKNTMLKDVSTTIIIKYIALLANEVEKILTQNLSDRLGIVIDDKVDDSSQYIAIYAFNSQQNQEQENPEKHPQLHYYLLDILHPIVHDLSTENFRNLICSILHRYSKDFSCISYFVGATCEKNKALAESIGKPLIACACYRLNLAIKHYLGEEQSLINRLLVFMTKLNNTKMMASLQRTGNLAVILSKTMQWSSTFQMISHYFELKPYLDLQDPELAKLLPSPKDDVKLTEKMKDLAAFESVYHKLLYSRDIDHNTLRQLFDALIRQFPQLDLYLAADSVCVYSVAFETGIAKIITGQERSLTKDEQEVCQPFRVTDDTADKSAMDSIINDNLSFAEKVLSKQTSKVTKSSAYEDVSYIPVMSTVTQQLTRNNIIDLTKSNDVMNPIYLRCIFLKLNRRLWDLPLLKKVVHRST